MNPLFKEIYTHYTTLDLTYQTDRPQAIKSLERRVAGFYDTNCTFGIAHELQANSSLRELISSVTGITRLTESDMECAGIAEKMPWTSKRDTK
jgi:hypothetical protein